jgi:dethiobiotin synthetase
VTGTDTNVGKTVVSAALMLRYRTLRLRYWKPIQTGIEQDDDTAEVARLSACGPGRIFDAGIRLRHAVSPHLAAALNSSVISLDAVAATIDAESAASSWIVEGAGGVLVPLNDESLVIDLICRLRLPAVIVSRSGLGTINHTLLTIEALTRRGIVIAGVVMVGAPNADNRKAIERYGGVAVLGELPPIDPLTAASIQRWVDGSLDRQGRLLEFFG